ncbi:Gfo/Idh/MocA family protein [Nocardia sp. NPDC020380]|uniref:Gfo/Idh/MocA family protein n=1 Tax=Nocardia sp. NPDC020380 TaxID=3364309 RepID=UPI003790BC56
MTLRLGVLGCAGVAWRRTLPSLARLPELTVAAIASRDPAKAAEFTRRFGGEAVSGYRALLDRPDIDAVYIPLPASLHPEWIDAALRAGLHVLVEKPLATTQSAANELALSAVARDRVLVENFAFLHHRAHAEVRALLAAGVIGELRAFTADFAFPPLPAGDIRYQPELAGGALFDAGVYPIRAAQLFLGPDLEVAGATLTMSPEYGVDIAGSALLTSPVGIPAQLHFGFAHSYRCAYTLWGEQGRISVHRAFTFPDDFTPVVRIMRHSGIEERTLAPDAQFTNGLAAFARAIRNSEKTDVDSIVRQAALVEAVATAARRIR